VCELGRSFPSRERRHLRKVDIAAENRRPRGMSISFLFHPSRAIVLCLLFRPTFCGICGGCFCWRFDWLGEWLSIDRSLCQITSDQVFLMPLRIQMFSRFETRFRTEEGRRNIVGIVRAKHVTPKSLSARPTNTHSLHATGKDDGIASDQDIFD